MKHKRGIIKLLVVIIAAIAALAYFRVDLRSWIESVENWWQSQDLAWLKDQFDILKSQFWGLIDRLR